MVPENISYLGVMGWPLALASCVSIAIILERLITYARLPLLSRRHTRQLLREVSGCLHCTQSGNNLCKKLVTGRGARKGIAVLLSHRHSDKSIREEIAGLWLLKQKNKLQTGLKPLMLIGILAPMLGLLGTVLGLIAMFQGISAVQGPVTPDVLAGGLWEAMFTTAVGLAIAIPSLAAAHGFGIWINYYLSKLEFVLNHANLLLEGLEMNDEGFANPPDPSVCPEATKL